MRSKNKVEQGWGRSLSTLWAVGAVALLVSCGGGGGNPGVCLGSAAVCNPSSNSSPYTGVLSPNVPSEQVAGYCDANFQKQFIRSYFNEAYLWSDEVPQVNSSPYTPAGYFLQLRVTTPDVLGLPKDRFSFVVENATADTISSGVGFGFGMRWVKDAQGATRVAEVIPGSPAALAGMARGGILVAVLATSHNTWSPGSAGETISFSYKANAAAATTTISLTSAAVTDDPVPASKVLTSGGGRRVGYVLFNAHTTGAQDKLISVMTTLSASGIQDLVLDLRYNSGGFLYTALSLGAMVTGVANDGKVFERLQFNRMRAADTEANVTLFAGTVQYGETTYAKGAALPRLGLPRVYVLTTGNTCSASEAVINALRGVDVEVTLIGGTTCGKPYGFTRRDNCGLSLYPIEFQGLNAKNFGDYMAGFTATCPAPDDLDRPLGDATEGMLARALHHADTGSCALPASVAREAAQSAPVLPATGLQLDLHTHRPGKVLRP